MGRRGAITAAAAIGILVSPLYVMSGDARVLFAGGRLYDALRALELVRPTDPLRADADQLKVTIQRELIAHGPAAQ